MKRTILIANTSNMPVAAREASVYTGITIAEYFRDMGYSVALMADSTSPLGGGAARNVRPARGNARRGRLSRLPAGSRSRSSTSAPAASAAWAPTSATGVLTVIGAVSPPGGDLSDPVVQATLRSRQGVLGPRGPARLRAPLPGDQLADQLLAVPREPGGLLDPARVSSEDWAAMRARRRWGSCSRRAELEEIVRLVGVDALVAATACSWRRPRSIREDFLHQNAFDEVDTYTSLPKQFRMLQ